MKTERPPALGGPSGGDVRPSTIAQRSSPGPSLVGQASLSLRQFFELIFGGLEGELCIAGKRPGGKFTGWRPADGGKAGGRGLLTTDLMRRL
jgi:hypothetical protein